MSCHLDAADMVPDFETVLRICKLQAGEKVLVATDPWFPFLQYATAAVAAARALGAKPYVMFAYSTLTEEDKLYRATWLNADLILGMTYLPIGYSWLYTELHNEALRAGARTLMVQEPPLVLRRMPPDSVIAARGLAGARLLEKSAEIRITSASGTELICRKEGRKGSYQAGIADIPGRWDHWPSGMVYCAPLEDTAEGVFVISPGDVLLGLGRFSHSEVRLYFEKGRVVSIEGGPEARLLEERLRAAGDDSAWRIAHLGWGTDHRADWSNIGMDSESMYGSVCLALGRNIFDSPVPHCGMGGSNKAPIHVDICCRSMNLYLDGHQIINKGLFQLQEIA